MFEGEKGRARVEQTAGEASAGSWQKGRWCVVERTQQRPQSESRACSMRTLHRARDRARHQLKKLTASSPRAAREQHAHTSMRQARSRARHQLKQGAGEQQHPQRPKSESRGEHATRARYGRRTAGARGRRVVDLLWHRTKRLSAEEGDCDAAACEEHEHADQDRDA